MSAKDEGLPIAPRDAVLRPSPVAIDFLLECDIAQLLADSLLVKCYIEPENKEVWSEA